jgi:3-phosphoshikimate 1-carboxyvinyltransferase
MSESPDTRTLYPCRALRGEVTPPGAKSATVRAVLSATLAGGTSSVRNGGTGDNVRAMVRACEAMGARVETGPGGEWSVTGVDHRLPAHLELDAGNSGIVLRLLAAVGAVTERCLVGSSCPESLGRRGNRELAEALAQLGAECRGEGEDFRPPLAVGRGGGLRGGRVTVSGRRSSQFLSGLLFLAPLVGEDLELEVVGGLTSRSMVRTTVQTLAAAGVEVRHDAGLTSFALAAGQRYRSATFTVPSDASSVAGLLGAAAAVPGSEVRIAGPPEDEGTDVALGVLERMGVVLWRGKGELVCRGAERLHPVEVDGSTCTDSVLPLAALACFAEGTSRFHSCETLRYKECDRISDFRRQLVAAGADVEETRDSLVVHGRAAIRGGATVDGCHDHSVVMALSALALRSELGLTVRGAGSVAQTYPTFFEHLAALGAGVEPGPPGGRA